MSDISFSCSQCGQHVLIDDSARGNEAKCPTCQTDIVVPHISTPPPLTPSATQARSDFSSPESIRAFLESRVKGKYKVTQKDQDVFVEANALGGCRIRFQPANQKTPVLVQAHAPSQGVLFGLAIVTVLICVLRARASIIAAIVIFLGGNIARGLPSHGVTKEVKGLLGV